MAKRKAKKPDVEKLDLEKTLRAALGNPPVGIQTLKDIHVFQRAMLKRETRRLEDKLGAEHPRVKRMHSCLGQNLKLLRDLEVEMEAASIRVPEVGEQEALIHGRVVSQGRRGYEAMLVTLEDETDKPLKFMGETKTDVTGYYTFRLDAEKLEAISKIKGQAAYLTVRDAQGKLVHRESKPLKVDEGERVFREVQLVRIRPTTRRPVREKKKPVAKKPPRKKPKKIEDEPWVIKGRVVDEQGVGLSGLMVRVVDKDRQFDDLLGATQTDKKGEFEVHYRLQDFREGLEPGADLFVLVSDAKGKVLYSSEDAVRFDAGREEEFEITIKRGDRKNKDA